MTWLFLIFTLIVLSGCRSVKYVSVPEYRTQTITKTDTITRQDSVWTKDSVFVFKSGDTMTVTRIVYRDRWHTLYRSVRDTVVKRDSIPYPIKEISTKKECMFASILTWILVCLLVAGVWVMYGILKEANKHENQ